MKRKEFAVKNQKNNAKVSVESRLIRFLSPYFKKIAAAAVILSVLVIAGVSWWSFQEWKADKAMNLFNNAQDEKGYSAVISQYPSAKAAKLALLKIIELKWNAGEYAEVEKNCQEFLKHYPDDLFAPFLKNILGEAYIQEKKLNEAEKVYSNFMKEGTGGYLFPLAQINLGRVYMEKNEEEKAKSFLSKMQNDPAFQFWNDSIDALIRKETVHK